MLGPAKRLQRLWERRRGSLFLFEGMVKRKGQASDGMISIHAEWQRGQRTAAWDALWEHIFREVLVPPVLADIDEASADALNGESPLPAEGDAQTNDRGAVVLKDGVDGL